MDLRTYRKPRHHGFMQGEFSCPEELSHYVSLAACHCRVLSVKPFEQTPEDVLDVLGDLSADGIVSIVSDEPDEVDVYLTGPDYHSGKKEIYVFMENIYDQHVRFLPAWREVRRRVVCPRL